MLISVFDSVSVSESFIKITPPSLYQTNLGIVAGSTYRLTFDAVISSGVLSAYQGNTLIYSSAIVFIGNANYVFDKISVMERVTLSFGQKISVFDSITITEAVYIFRL